MRGGGITSSPMRKLCRARSVCAPQWRSAGTSMGPKVSLSVRVLLMHSLFAEAIEPHHLGAGSLPAILRLVAVIVRCFILGSRGGDHARAGRRFCRRLALGALH